MRRLRHLLAGLTAALAAVIALLIPTYGTAHAESNGGVRVMPLGDSITDGLTVPGGYRIGLWQDFVADGYKVDFVGSLSNGPAGLGDHDHEGHSGWTIAQIDANISGWLQTYDPHTILLHIGTNDMYGSDPAGAPARLATLLDHITAQKPDAEVFVATIIPLACCDATVRTYDAAIPGIVQSRINQGKHLHLVDMYPALTTADLADGVHPNAGGYDKMAAVWYKALQSVPGSIGSSTTTTGGTTTGGTSGTTTGGTSSGGTTTGGTSGTTTGGTSSGGTTTGGTSTGGTTTGGTGGSACTATYKVVNSWGGGLQAEVTVSAGGSALNGWTVRMTLPSGESISNLWNGVNTGTTGAVSVKNAAYNAGVSAGASTTFGYVASGSSSAAPTGVTCSSP
ncbi:MAG: SGNH hydrolase [Streptomyces sp.]|nr:SGNH hydrolase [Streptomyces sp.]